MKTPKLPLALLLGLCLVCVNGPLYADDDNGAAAATEIASEGESASNESGAGTATAPAGATEAEAKKETPAAATAAQADDEKNAAPATIMEEPAPGAAHPQEIAIIPFKGYDLDGRRVDVGACIGVKPVLLVFWASWCPTCKSEVPRLNKLADRFGDRMGIVGVNIAENDTYKRAKAFAARTDMRYPNIYDASRLLSWQYAIRGLPTVVVADKKGIVRYYGPGSPDITEEVFAELTAD